MINAVTPPRIPSKSKRDACIPRVALVKAFVDVFHVEESSNDENPIVSSPKCAIKPIRPSAPLQMRSHTKLNKLGLSSTKQKLKF